MSVLRAPYLRWPLWLMLLAIPLLMIWGDAPTAHYMATLPDGVRDVFRIITIAGESHYVLVPTGVAALVLWGLWKRSASAVLLWWMQANLFVFSAVAVGGILTNIIKIIVGRARPKHLLNDGIYAFEPLTTDGSWHSFPSGHTNTAIGAALALAMLFPRLRWPLLIMGAVIAASRMVVTAHYPADVLGGAALALLTCWGLGQAFARRGALFTLHGAKQNAALHLKDGA